MQGGVRFLRLFAALLAVAALTPAFGSLDASAPWLSKLDPMLQQRVLTDRKGSSPVIIRFADGKSLQTAVQVIEESEGAARRRLPIIEGHVAVIPNRTLLRLAARNAVERISLDRPVMGANELTGATVGATAARQEFGYDGAGVGVVIIDSGVSASHHDLSGANGASRVVRFVDFINDQATGLRRLRPRHARRRNHRRQWLGLRRRARGYCSGGAPRRAQSSRWLGPRQHQRCDCGAWTMPSNIATS